MIFWRHKIRYVMYTIYAVVILIIIKRISFISVYNQVPIEIIQLKNNTQNYEKNER
jgi:hypothetical protein